MKAFNLGFIKQRRQELGMTLQEAAEAMEMKNASTYMKYENGTYSLKADQLPLLAEALQCSTENFFIKIVAKTAMKGGERDGKRDCLCSNRG